MSLESTLGPPCQTQGRTEQGDAGDPPGTAQIPAGTGALTTIFGDLGTDDADMYCITIDTQSTLNIETCTGASFDTQLFLFRNDGMGVGMNDDACSLQSRISPATMNCAHAVGAGEYYIAVSRYNKHPMDAQGALLWLSGVAEHCADGPGAANPIAGWGSSTSTAGAYQISMTAVSYCGASTPAAPTTWGGELLPETGRSMVFCGELSRKSKSRSWFKRRRITCVSLRAMTLQPCPCSW